MPAFDPQVEYTTDYFRDKPLDIPKITILFDHGYHSEKIQFALEAVYPEIMTKIQFERSPKPSKPLEQVRDLIRLKHYSYRTEETDIQGMHCYILFQNQL